MNAPSQNFRPRLRKRTGTHTGPDTYPLPSLPPYFRCSSALALIASVALILLLSAYAHALPGSRQFNALALLIGTESTGTAFHIGRGCWVSAAHLARGRLVILHLFHNNSPRFASITRIHPYRDVSLLQGPAIDYSLRLSTRLPEPGERVWAAGFPGDSRWYGRPVAISGVVHVNTGDSGWIWLQGVAFRGHSGSPLLDRNNRVLGVLVGAHGFWLDVTFAEPSRAILDTAGGHCK